MYVNVVDLEKLVLKNARAPAIRGVETAENEPIEVGAQISKVSRMGHSLDRQDNGFEQDCEIRSGSFG